MHTSNVLRMHQKTHVRLGLHVVSDSSAEVTSSERGASQTEQRFAVISSHANLRLDDLSQDLSEGFLQRIGLLLEELVTLLGSDSLRLIDSQVPT